MLGSASLRISRPADAHRRSNRDPEKVGLETLAIWVMQAYVDSKQSGIMCQSKAAPEEFGLCDESLFHLF
jgi:hypothetical protein